MRTFAALLGLGAALGCGSPPAPARPARVLGSVEIHWDRHQVPHVLAEDREGVGYGLGYAELRAYPEEIVRLYAIARGEAATLWGEPYRRSDRLVRTLGIPQRAAESLRARSPEMRAYLEAFARGLNDFATAHPERFSPEARGFFPVRAEDVLAHGHRLFLAFTLLGQPPAIVYVDGEVPVGVAGSNFWAIAPSRSASGNPMALLSPHLPWHVPAARMFEAHLVGPDGSLYGATLVGLPVLMNGWNDAIAWGGTINVLDAADVYALTRDGDGYRFDGETRAFEVHDEIVRVRQPDGSMREEPLRIRRSVHGPVIEHDDGNLYALRAGIDGAEGGWADAWAAIGRARDVASFEAALRTTQLPMFNWGYAGRDGHLLFVSTGRVPRRAEPDFERWRRAVPGDTSATLWHEVLPYEALPRIADPPSGFVQSANSVPWLATLPPAIDPADYTSFGIPDGPLWLREIHALRMLSADMSITWDELRTMRRSSRLELADHVLDALIAAARASDRPSAREAAEVLAAWDRQTRAESRGAVLFQAYAARMFERPGGGFAEPWSAEQPLETPRGIADPAGALADLEAAADEVRARCGALDCAWGEVNRLRDDLPGVGGPDDLGSFHNIEYAPDAEGRGRPVAGESFVARVELRPEGPRAEVLLTYGNESEDAPFAGDQLDLLSRGELREPLLGVARIRAEAIESVTVPPR